MLSDDEMYKRMARGWRGGKGNGTLCGQGSTHRNTEKVRDWLPKVTATYGIQSVCDAGAGDLHWIKHVDWPVDYQAFDLIPRHSDVVNLDITTERLPECDAILCRMVLNHLGEARTKMALKLFAKSARYLLATHFENDVNRTREFTRLDLRKWLGDPLEKHVDGHEDGCYLALWKL